MLKPRTRLLISGDGGSGKTTAVFSVVNRVLRDTKSKMYFMDHDGGSARFLELVDQDLVCLPQDESKEEHEAHKDSCRFTYYLTPDWISARDAYRDVRGKYKEDDWVVLDRLDLLWESTQSYFNAALNEVSESDLDELYLERRIEKRKLAEQLIASGDEKKAREGRSIKTNPSTGDAQGTDWGPIKDAYNSIAYDNFAGRDPTRKHINVVATALARPKESVYTGGSEKRNPRDLAGFGYVVRGETNITSLPDTHILVEYGPLGYQMSTVKDRLRTRFRNQQIGEFEFVDKYEELVGKELV